MKVDVNCKTCRSGKMRLIWLLPTMLFFSACATPNTMMVNPSNGQISNCAASGWGWAGAPLAIMSHDSCVDSLRSIGYVTVEEYRMKQAGIDPTKEQLAKVERLRIIVTSKPGGANVYAGPNTESLKYLGKTRLVLSHPNKEFGSAWAAECYQVKKSGFYDSRIRCVEKTTSDREINFILVPE